MALHIACTSLFSPFPFGIGLVGYKIPLLEVVSSVYLSCLNMPEYACRLSFKQKADHRNVARALGLERLLYFPSLAKEIKKKIQIAITKVPEPIPNT